MVDQRWLEKYAKQHREARLRNEEARRRLGEESNKREEERKKEEQRRQREKQDRLERDRKRREEIEKRKQKEKKVELDRKNKIEKIARQLKLKSIEGFTKASIRQFLEENNWSYQRALKQIKDIDQENKWEREKQQRALEAAKKRLIKEGVEAPNLALWLNKKFEHLEKTLEQVSGKLVDVSTRLDNIENHLEVIGEWQDDGSHDLSGQGEAEEYSKTNAQEFADRILKVVKVNFEILRPGKWKPQDIIEHYRRLAAEYPTEFQAQNIQWERIKEIQKLDPQTAYIGKNLWRGYAIYDFSYSANVLLECPIEGNAVYILKGPGWDRLVRLTKGEIRDTRKGSYKKVVHKNDWLARVSRGLRTL